MYYEMLMNLGKNSRWKGKEMSLENKKGECLLKLVRVFKDG